MSRFIHEGTAQYWTHAIAHPTRWARWIVLRTDDMNDQTFRLLSGNAELEIIMF